MGLWAVAAASAQPAPATVASEPAKVTFSKLVFRVEREAEIAVAKQDYRVFILEELRKQGFHAVGAESLVFEQDDSAEADYVLGGTIREVKCREQGGKPASCFLGIVWELLDARQDAVAYRVGIRHPEHGLDKVELAATVGKRLVLGSLRRLMQRPKLVALLRESPSARQASKPGYASATLRSCERAPIVMPGAADQALAAAVMIESGKAVGSGFVVSPDGFVLTAAHVLKTVHPTVAFRDGSKQTADVIRIAPDHDVALLRLQSGGREACLPLASDVPLVGAEIYAVGAPAGKQLAFSITRGIVSGVRDFDGVQHVQTDASISPGNSGGPLVDASGRAVGVVSWKVYGAAVEGIAFGVPVATALDALSLTLDSSSGEALKVALTRLPGERKREPSMDTMDPIPSLDPAADRERAEDAREEERDRRISAITPWYVPALRWGGVALVATGVTGAVLSMQNANPGDREPTREEFEDARLLNDLSWVAVMLGTGAFALSYPMTPDLPQEPSERAAGSARWSVAAGPAGVQVRGWY